MDQPDMQSSIGFSSSLNIINQVGELARVALWLEQMAKHLKLSERTVFKLDLVLNEALPNIISYAYQDQLRHEILIKLTDRGDRIVLDIIDDGMAFNPFAYESVQESSSLESASITGRGIQLISSFSDGQEYQRIDHTNVMQVSIFKTSEAHHQYSAAATAK